MPSLECPHAAHRVVRTKSVQSNVYAASAGNDMPLTLYAGRLMRLVRFTYSNQVHD
jgi:hypothetical protein